MMRRSSLHISLIVMAFGVLTSCEKGEPIDAQQRQYAVVDAFLKAGENISNINVSTLTIDGENEGISDLSIYIRSDEGNYFLQENDDLAGNYFFDDRDEVFVPGADYDLTFDYKGMIISAETTIPPAMTELSLSSTTFRSNMEEERIWIDWSDINTGSTAEYFYIVKLTPLEEFDVLVPIEGRSRDADRMYRSGEVLLNPESTLTLDDFNYYGDHRIEVFAISNMYKHLFEEQADITSNGLTNVENGTGYFVGVSAVSAVLEVE